VEAHPNEPKTEESPPSLVELPVYDWFQVHRGKLDLTSTEGYTISVSRIRAGAIPSPGALNYVPPLAVVYKSASPPSGSLVLIGYLGARSVCGFSGAL
jgi:hypothetical protein